MSHAITTLMARASSWFIPESGLVQWPDMYKAPAALSGNLTLDYTYPSLIKLDPGAAHRDITLEADGTAALKTTVKGRFRWILNGGSGNNLVVKDSDGNTLGTINQNESGIFYADETSGWALVCIIAIALS